MRRNTIRECKITVESKDGKYTVRSESYDQTKRCISADHRTGFDSPIVALSWACERLNVVNQNVKVGVATASATVVSGRSLPSPVHETEAIDNTGEESESGVLERLDRIIELLENAIESG